MVRHRFLVPLLALAFTGACSNGAHPDTEVVDAGGTSVLVLKELGEGGSAGVGIFGDLRLVGERCVGFVMGLETALLVFPPHTSVSGSGADVVIHVQGTDLRLGEHFTGGSRSGAPEPLSHFGDLGKQIPSSCRGLPAVAYTPDPH
ncbi:hypothetical protein FB382_001900 [Nocardioides ginsengisegetis]|uniref:Lipoprotein n=1 Tax=Nocardioides ginsengisegetis TaxID=661491 RepID=A0A7W3P9N1_9ACTN|nr:hypothetical protein [Nocardioides ginsengisegetis]MBA8803609.1 hypothetical protein [Nocardioides ginsengisegetis]